MAASRWRTGVVKFSISLIERKGTSENEKNGESKVALPLSTAGQGLALTLSDGRQVGEIVLTR